MEHRIKRYLMAIGVPPNLNGFYHIARCTELFIECIRSSQKPRICKLYEIVAQEKGDTACAVERGIRHAIQRCFDENERAAEMLGIFFDPDKLNNSHFIATVAMNVMEQDEF